MSLTPPPSTPSSSAAPAPPTPAAGASSAPKVPTPPREIPPVLRPLEYMGIPKSVLSWKPRLPSRNWSIFLLTVSTLSYLYYDDRRQCRLIRADYIDKVSHLSLDPMKPSDWPRKITVYATRSPGDDDYDKALRYFKKYVKPVLVAAGVDWEVTNGTRHGGLARELQSKIMERRRKLIGLEPWMTEVEEVGKNQFSLSPQEELQREIDGGLVLVGRPALKEWAWAMREGWCKPLEVLKRDREDELARELAEDHAFDELPEPSSTSNTGSGESEFLDEKDRAIAALAEGGGEEDGAGAPLPSRFGGSPYNLGGPNAFSGMLGPSPAAAAQAEKQRARTEAEAAASRLDPRLLEPPNQIPAQPPICFVDFTNLIGWRNIPLRMYQFFRQRDKVQHGAELALTLVYGTKETAREFDATPVGAVPQDPPQGGDLDWGLESESRYTPYFLKTDKNISDARSSYYKSLPKHLKDARDLARGLREQSKIEKNDPSKTESELREERFKKEKEWRNNEMGFEIVRPERGVEWDERFRGSLRVFELSKEKRGEIEREQKERREQEREGKERREREEKAEKEEMGRRMKELESRPLEEIEG